MRAGRVVSAVDFQALADLRYRIRRFLRLRETAARSAGIEPQQYLVLLQIKGLQGRGPATISALAERLQVRHHAVVQLVTRLTRRGLVERTRADRDRREVVVALLPAGERLLQGLAGHSIGELTTEGPLLMASLRRLIVQSTRGGTLSRTGRRRSER